MNSIGFILMLMLVWGVAMPIWMKTPKGRKWLKEL